MSTQISSKRISFLVSAVALAGMSVVGSGCGKSIRGGEPDRFASTGKFEQGANTTPGTSGGGISVPVPTSFPAACGGYLASYRVVGDHYDVDFTNVSEHSPNTQLTFDTEPSRGIELLRFATHLQTNLLHPDRKVVGLKIKACTMNSEGILAVESHVFYPGTSKDWELDTIGYTIANCASAQADEWITVDLSTWVGYNSVRDLCTATLNVAGSVGEVKAVQVILE